MSIKYPFNLARLRISIILHNYKDWPLQTDNQQTVSFFLDLFTFKVAINTLLYLLAFYHYPLSYQLVSSYKKRALYFLFSICYYLESFRSILIGIDRLCSFPKEKFFSLLIFSWIYDEISQSSKVMIKAWSNIWWKKSGELYD